MLAYTDEIHAKIKLGYISEVKAFAKHFRQYRNENKCYSENS